MIPKAGLPKLLPGVKVPFLNQIPKRPCQPDISLGFILSLSIYSDGHCTKLNVSCSDRLIISKTISDRTHLSKFGEILSTLPAPERPY